MDLDEFQFDGGFISYKFEPLPWSYTFTDEARAKWYDSVQYSKNYKKDIDYLREQYPEVAHWNDIVLVEAWLEFCTDVYYASFLTPSRDYLFLAWLYDICDKYKQNSNNKETLTDFNNPKLIKAANQLWAMSGQELKDESDKVSCETEEFK
ncbi:MAG: hypothetical protein JO235_10420 [Chroococcidiopsidaceae cyanobacterium CP_BM_RX_35]|nr:hypothetical protein [Chroococcidiopsidaceae cyanobacterium CP_BM_RX_35]